MLKSTLLKRIFLIGLAGLLLFLLVFVRSLLIPRPIRIGDFIMPALPGWEQKVTRTTRVTQTTYRKQTQGNELYLSLVWDKARSSKRPPRTVEDLQNEEQKGRQEMAPRLERLKMTVQPLLKQPTSLNGMPALLVQDIIRGHRVAQSKTLLFIKGHNYYILTATVSVPSTATSPNSAQAQAESDQAWKTITEGLTPS